MGVVSLRGYLTIIMILAMVVGASAAMAADSICGCPPSASGPCAPGTCPNPVSVLPPVSSAAAVDTNLETFQTSMISSCLNVPQASITNWRNRGFTYGQIAMAANVANRAGVSLDDVMAQLQNGQGWNAIASNYNLNMADITSVSPSGRLAMAPEVQNLSNAFLMRQYGLTQADIDRFQARGFNNGQIALAANLAARSGRSVESVLDMSAQGMSWTDIATQLNVSPSLAIVPVSPPVNSQEAALMRTMLARQFALTGSQIDQLRARGLSFSEIAQIGNIAIRTGRSPMDIADMHAQGMTWTQIAENVGISVAALNNPYSPTLAQTPGGAAAGRRLPRTGR